MSKRIETTSLYRQPTILDGHPPFYPFCKIHISLIKSSAHPSFYSQLPYMNYPPSPPPPLLFTKKSWSLLFYESPPWTPNPSPLNCAYTSIFCKFYQINKWIGSPYKNERKVVICSSWIYTVLKKILFSYSCYFLHFLLRSSLFHLSKCPNQV